VRDNDRAYGHVFTSRIRTMGIRDRPISPGSPWQNGYAERLISTLRRELSFPKITSVRIRAVRQNQRMIQRDARGPDSDWSACRQPVQVAAPT
jgi:transposase InsO family protein